MTTDVDRAFADVVERLRAVTVAVEDGARGAGAGVVWAPGLVVTNAHVAAGRRARVRLEPNQEPLAAIVMARDERRDLAALAVAGLTMLPAAIRYDPPRPGELALAVGNPFGLRGAATAGLVQRCNSRAVIADVRLAPGNSGGPLADAVGRVIGINSMIARGRAVAVPSAVIREFLSEAAGATLGQAV